MHFREHLVWRAHSSLDSPFFTSASLAESENHSQNSLSIQNKF